MEAKETKFIEWACENFKKSLEKNENPVDMLSVVAESFFKANPEVAKVKLTDCYLKTELCNAKSIGLDASGFGLLVELDSTEDDEEYNLIYLDEMTLRDAREIVNCLVDGRYENL